MGSISKYIAVTALILALAWAIHHMGYSQREYEFKVWVQEQELKAINKHLEDSQKLKEVTENAIIQQQKDNVYIDSIRDSNFRLQQQADHLQSRIAATNKDADSLKEMVSEITKLLGRCETRASQYLKDYRENERITLEFKNRLSIYEQ